MQDGLTDITQKQNLAKVGIELSTVGSWDIVGCQSDFWTIQTLVVNDGGNCVGEVRRAQSVMKRMHHGAQFVLDALVYWQPVPLTYRAGITWSRARSPSMRRAAAFCTRCRGAVVDFGRLAKTELP